LNKVDAGFNDQIYPTDGVPSIILRIFLYVSFDGLNVVPNDINTTLVNYYKNSVYSSVKLKSPPFLDDNGVSGNTMFVFYCHYDASNNPSMPDPINIPLLNFSAELWYVLFMNFFKSCFGIK
jgi:hypothetical protein